jgi:hypothetical protein
MILKRLVQREMRCGSESVLDARPGVTCRHCGGVVDPETRPFLGTGPQYPYCSQQCWAAVSPERRYKTTDREWTAERHAAAKAWLEYVPPLLGTNDESSGDYLVDAIAEIERLKALISGKTETSLNRQVEELRHTIKLRNNYIEDREAMIEHQDGRIAELEKKRKQYYSDPQAANVAWSICYKLNLSTRIEAGLLNGDTDAILGVLSAITCRLGPVLE